MARPLPCLLSASGGFSAHVSPGSSYQCITPATVQAMVPATPPGSAPGSAPDFVSAKSVLSAPRLGTYLHAADGDEAHALDLYVWNARVCAALMVPAHFAEVATRNAVDQVLTTVYGQRWPWDYGFELSVPSGGPYDARRDLVYTRGKYSTTGKVIAELRFAFWQKTFTSRHDGRLWVPHILAAFPGATTTDPKKLRGRIYADLEVIRKLRNRMAHHEPVFTRDLRRDVGRMYELVDLRSAPTGAWVRALTDDLLPLIAAMPAVINWPR